MDAKTREALEASIKHWEENAAADTPIEATIDPDSCALCGLFWRTDCVGCPIAQNTKTYYCAGSPYIAAVKAHEDWRNHEPDETSAKDNWQKAAIAEVVFLKSLLPEGEQESAK